MPITQADRLAILYQGIPADTNDTLLHTVGANKSNVRNVVTFSNNSATASVTVEIHLVPPAQSPADLYRYLPPLLVVAEETVDVIIPHDLEEGWAVYATTSVADQVTVMYSAKIVS